jgi:UDP-3-O-[3-hydroxymyristoyl] glucosamine N-acyltransferase
MLTKVKDVAITKIAPPLLADENTLALALGEDEIANLANTKAQAALVPLGVNIDGFTTIEVERPRLAMMKLITMFYEAPHVNSGVHATAVVHPTAKIGENVSLGPNVVVGEYDEIGDNTKILANCYIGNSAKIGNNCFFHPAVNIGDRVKVGNEVILHHGVSLGADGFSFVTENPNNIEQAKKDGEIKENDVNQVIFKIPSIGSVVIGNNVVAIVYVGNAVIDEKTSIERANRYSRIAINRKRTIRNKSTPKVRKTRLSSSKIIHIRRNFMIILIIIKSARSKANTTIRRPNNRRNNSGIEKVTTCCFNNRFINVILTAF